MGHNSQALSANLPQTDSSGEFCFGPLNYRLFPHDDWGLQIVSGMGSALLSADKLTDCTRTIHLSREEIHAPETPVGKLPASLQSHIHGQENSWQRVRNRTGCTWHSHSTTESFWVDGAATELGEFAFQLPWNLLITDIAAIGGGLMHGGLVDHHGQGVFFLAPPGGGKSTTLATAPAGWEVLSDDAALVWPQGEDWFASPLPSWTTMTMGKTANDRFDPAPRPPVSTIVLLTKGRNLSLAPVAAKDAAAAVYRGLTEYPATVFSELPLNGHLFRTACQMARTLPCWQLQLPLGGNCWPLLSENC